MARRTDVQFRKVTPQETGALINQSRIIAVFSEVGDAYGLMMNGDKYLTREEKAALIRAARALPTSD